MVYAVEKILAKYRDIKPYTYAHIWTFLNKQ